MNTPQQNNPITINGFDSPIKSRKDDHLNRWPLAQEILGIATTGPKEWSVRIGVYGEWGTGKTSVLRFVDSMATQAGHIVIWFNPWKHSTKGDLWKAFVLCVFENLKKQLGQIPGAAQATRKAWIKKANNVLGSLSSITNSKTGKIVEVGLNLVEKHFDFGPKDLTSLESILGHRRIIVLIDDLDRTDPEMVPEMLFALKELMDIPSFSFICAFDPIVVGEVLGNFHPGFGDGLKFLDKIIDYPRWLPPVSCGNLANLAVAETMRSCNYVPQIAIRETVPLLPQNPRAIRQFIRLITLLKPHIERHYDYELKWPVILTANILKIQYPRLAHALLNDPSFWSRISVMQLTSREQIEKEELNTLISEHIEKILTTLGFPKGYLEDSKKNDVKNILNAICSYVSLFSGLDKQDLAFQVNVAEEPAAVTWKEFDSFFKDWKYKQETSAAAKWIAVHAQYVKRPNLDVYREVLKAAIQRYAEALQKADSIFFKTEKPAFVKDAESLLALLKALVFELGKLNQPVNQIGNDELDFLLNNWTLLIASNLTVHMEFWQRNEDFILALFEKWSPDVMPLIRILRPHAGVHLRNFDRNAATINLHNKLCDFVLPRYCQQLIESFREPDFNKRLLNIKDDNAIEIRQIMWDVKSPIWNALRGELFLTLAEAPTNRSIQSNAYEFLCLSILQYQGEGDYPVEPKDVKALLSDQGIFDALWNAATATPLAERAVYHLKKLPEIANELGIEIQLPNWWIEITKIFNIPPPQIPDSGSTP